MIEHAHKARKFFALAIVAAGLAVSGCATNRSEISLMANAAPSASASLSAPAAAAIPAPTRGTIVLGRVTDTRVFEVAPRDPSVPSVGNEGGGAEVQARLVGRKRNSYGRAIGDVILPANETVVDVMRQNATLAFQRAGYAVVDASAAPAGTPVVDVEVTKFWTWFSPGFWTIKLEMNIETRLTISGRAEPVVITGYHRQENMAASEAAWLEALQAGIAAYHTQATTVLAQPILPAS